MRVLLEFGHFCLLFFKFNAGLIRIRVLFEGGSLSRIYGKYELHFIILTKSSYSKIFFESVAYLTIIFAVLAVCV